MSMIDIDMVADEAIAVLSRDRSGDFDDDIADLKTRMQNGKWNEASATAMCWLTGVRLYPRTDGVTLFGDHMFPDEYGPWTEALIAMYLGLDR